MLRFGGIFKLIRLCVGDNSLEESTLTNKSTTHVFIQAREADAGMIGNIIMVGITVALAAVAGLFLSLFMQDTETVPSITFQEQGQGQRLMIITVSGSVPWTDIGIEGCDTYPASDNVSAGQFIEDCGQVVKISHLPTKTLLWRR